LFCFPFYSRSFCLVLCCVACKSCDQSAQDLFPGCFVCVILFRWHSIFRCFRVCYYNAFPYVIMCINACPLLSSFPSFRMPRYTHSCVCSWDFPLSSAIVVSLISLVNFCHIIISLYFAFCTFDIDISISASSLRRRIFRMRCILLF